MLLLGLIIFHLGVAAQTWITETVTISYNSGFNTTLWFNAGVKAYICNEDGKYEPNGMYVMLDNTSNYTLYYRSSVKGDHYERIRDRKFITWSPANVLTYFEVPPHQKEIIAAGGYFSKEEFKLPKKMSAEFKYFGKKNSKNTKSDSTIQPTRNVVKTSGDNTTSFYVYMAVKVSVQPKASQFSSLQSPKNLFIISAPILHRGKLTDDLTSEKEEFLNNIKNQITEKNEELQKIIFNKDFSKIEVHYGKLYSRVILKTKENAVDAIEDYKKSTASLFDGLAQVEFQLLN